MKVISLKGSVTPYKIQEWEKIYEDLFNLETVKNLVGNHKEDIKVEIDSFGGDVDEGLRIYSFFRKYAKENNAKIITHAVGRCDSIATIIFLAGDSRIGNKFIEPFIHNPWMPPTEGEMDADHYQKQSNVLKLYEDKIAKFYSEHTALTFDEAKEIMKEGTYLLPEELIDIKFATEIEEVERPVNSLKILNKNKKVMNKKNQSILNKIGQLLNGPSNAVEINTAEGKTLVFNSLEEHQAPKKGDKAIIDGENADGEYIGQDGATYVFNKGELTEIKEKEEDLEPIFAKLDEILRIQNSSAEEVASMRKELDEVKASNAKYQGVLNSLKDLTADFTPEVNNGGKQEGNIKNRASSAIANLKK